jgi:hypothetical protein
MRALANQRSALGYLWQTRIDHSSAIWPIKSLRPAARQRASIGHAASGITEQVDLGSDLPRDSPIWTSKSRWILFSDLHVSEDTLATCIEVLRHVRHTAAQLDAGVVFLGRLQTCNCSLISLHSQGCWPLTPALACPHGQATSGTCAALCPCTPSTPSSRSCSNGTNSRS